MSDGAVPGRMEPESDADETRSEIVERNLKPGRWYRVRNILGGVAWGFVAWMVLDPPSGYVSWISLLPLALSVSSSLHLFRRALSRKPVLEWDEEGLTDRSSVLGDELFIPWSDIESVRPNRMNGTVRLEFVDDPAHRRGLGVGRRIQRGIHRILGISGLPISATATGVKYLQLSDVLEDRLLAYETRQLTQPGEAGPLKDPAPEG